MTDASGKEHVSDYYSMIDIDKVIDVIKKDNRAKLVNFFREHKELMHRRLLECLEREPRTPYLRFVLETPEGLQRSRYVLDAFEEALAGNVEVYFSDQERIGNIRAVQGYQLKDILVFVVCKKRVLCEVINEYNSKCECNDDLIGVSDLFLLNYITDYSYIILSHFFIAKRDEIINRSQNQLHALQRYTARVISVLQKEDVWEFSSQGIFEIFGLYGFFLPQNSKDTKLENVIKGKIISARKLQDLVKKMTDVFSHSFRAIAIDADDNLVLFNEGMERECFKLICFHILPRNSRQLGLFFIHDQGRVFKFETFDRNLLNQFLYLTESVLSNCLMVQGIDEKREELHKLTGRLISIQEDGRRKIAAEIHDTVTQALSGIGYRALACQELIKKDPVRLDSELTHLIASINEALRKSRQIISNLRPNILDDIGIITAIQKVLKDFQESENIETTFLYSEGIDVSIHIGIALYRILQEAIHNTRKYAQATKVDVSLTLADNECLSLAIQDNGRGFDPNGKIRYAENSGMGFLIMRERAEDLGGELEVASKTDKGCRIVVRIPFKGRREDAEN